MRKPNDPLLQKRDENILSDFKRYFNKGLRQEVIYQKLSEKYYLTESTLTRIVRKQARQLKINNHNHDKK